MPHLGVLRYLNLPLCFLMVYFFCRRKFLLIYFLLTAIVLDLYSIFPRGIYFVIFILIFLLLNWLQKRFIDISSGMNLLITITVLFAYQLFLTFLVMLIHYFRIFSWPVIFDRLYFREIILFILLNTVLIFIVNQLCSILLKSKRLT
ncbi:MAG: hypothetical protein PHY10_03780 [Patescibacteria group bacterium]|nr:hypothetical protein [Patescibacteria group bacterium]